MSEHRLLRKRTGRRLVIPMILAVAATVMTVSPASAATSTFTGSLDASGTNWQAHNVTLGGAGTINASLDWSPTSANLNLFLYDPSGTLAASAVSLTTRPETITFAASSGGQWKLGVRAKSGSASYTLSVSYPGSTTNPVPSYVRTIGGPGHADIYPSGIDVAGGTLYVADTGDDQVQAYDGQGNVLWTTAKVNGKVFSNPRDVAYLAGEVYVADTGNARVSVLDATTGAPEATQWTRAFGTIMGISGGVDGNGDPVVLVSQSLPVSTVQILSPGGTLIRSIGTGPGTGNGQLNEERDAATDSAGNVYVADYKNQRIAKFGPLGAWIGSWGSMGTGNGQFRLPYGVDLDDQGNVYVADGNNERIQKFTSTGAFLKIYGAAGSGPGQFQMLRRVAVGSGTSPDVFGADLWQYKVERFAQTGTYEMTYGGAPPPVGLFNEAYGFSVGPTWTFVADTTNQRIQRFSSSSPYSFQLTWGERGWGEGNPGFNWPRDLTVTSDGHVWVADTKNNRLTEFLPDGTPTGGSLGSVGSGVGQLNYPYAIAASGGDLLVADSKNNRVQRWDPATGSVLWTATGFSFPRDLSVNGGHVWVADTKNSRIVELDLADGSMVQSFGVSTLHGPEGVAVDPGGNVWVADTLWNRLVEFDPSGGFIQKFGGAGAGNNQFNWPAHLEIVQASGQVQLFVADVENDRIQVFSIG